MHNLLSSLLNRRGIKDASELSGEEKQSFESWQKVLVEEEVTPQSMADFCTNEIAAIELQFKDLSRPEYKTERLVLLHSVYSALLSFIKGKKHEKEALVKYLTSLLKE